MLQGADGEGHIGAVAFGVPPGLAWHPLGGPESFDAVELGYVIAPADVALWAPKASALGVGVGRVEAVVIADGAEAAMVRVGSATARAGRGLEGDRYFDQRGTFSSRYARGHDLTLIEGEVLDALTLPAGQFAPEEARQNIGPAASTSMLSSARDSRSARSSASASACVSHAPIWSA